MTENVENTGHEMVVVQNQAVTPYDWEPAEFNAALQRRSMNRKALLDWIRDSLVEGTDWGKIHTFGRSKCSQGKNCSNPHHFSKPVLFKSGSEKICGMLGLSACFPDLPELEKSFREGVELKTLLLHCELVNGAGVPLAMGAGARSLQQDSGDVNKCLKMALKSAQIDATLRLGLSQIFTQDLDDMPPKEEADNEPVYRVTLTQLRKLYARLKGYDLEEERVLKYCRQKWGIQTLEDLRYEQFQELDTKLEKFAQTVKAERAKQPLTAAELRKLVSFHAQSPCPLNLVEVIRKVGANRIEDVTSDLLPSIFAFIEDASERVAIQNPDGAPTVYVKPGTEAGLMLEEAARLRKEAQYADGSGAGSSGYYQTLELATNLESVARKLLQAEQDELAGQVKVEEVQS
jgi:hypothetical protein